MSIDIIDSLAHVPGGRVFIRRWNSGNNQHAPIILLHDSLGCVELWRDFPAALAKLANREVIAYDRLGFGKSTPRTERPSANFVFEEGEIFFPAIQHALGLTRFSLFGHSVGGAMALVIAALQGEGCEAVMTEAAQCFVEPLTLSSISAAKEQFSDAAQFARIAKWHGENAQWVVDAWTGVWLSSEFLTWNLDQHLSQVRCPVLAVHGDRDEYGSLEFPRRIASGAGGLSEMAILEDCGHVPHRERKEEVLRLVSSFLTRD